jgi:biotin synthase-related radical SAM superfamily protein
VLRAVGHSEPGSDGESRTVRVSSGSAVVLGLEAWRIDVAPTTAYLMIGDRCVRNCAFCAQARGSTSAAGQLARVGWPQFALGEAVHRVALAFVRGAIQRCCLQVTAGPGRLTEAGRVLREIRAACAVPVCVSARVDRLGEFAELLDLGAERVTVALDAASERVYNRLKGRDWQKTLALLRNAAERHPGHVGTHIIVGLGETEAEVVALLQAMHDLGITTGLFAFTPVPGTVLAEEPSPQLAVYRRVQAARYLIVEGRARAEGFSLSSSGAITSYGMDPAVLRMLLQGGRAFQTSGCPGCNRPYYNERPSGPLYNYPRPLQPAEAAAAIELVIDSLDR